MMHMLTQLHKQESVYYDIFPKQRPRIEGVVLHRVGISGLFSPKQDRGFGNGTATPKNGSSVAPGMISWKN